MAKFKKAYSLKIISVVAAITFFVTSTSYGIDLSGNSHLRTPLLFDTEEEQKNPLLIDEIHRILLELPSQEREFRQVEHTTLGSNETNRYKDFFTYDTASRDWPVSNLIKDRILAKWLHDWISLTGKTVIHYRPEYYPFFGLETVKFGAFSYLVDPRDIPYVEDFILGRKRFSREKYLQAQQNMRDISPLSDIVSEYAERLLKLPPAQLIGLIVRTRLKIADYIWNRLTDIERKYYIFQWIKDKSRFSLDAVEYFNSRSEYGDKSRDNPSWWALSDEERFAYLMQFLGENFSQAIRSEVESVALQLLREKSLESLSEEEKFSYTIGEIYGRLISFDIMFRDKEVDDRKFDEFWHKTLEQKLFSERDDIKRQLRENIRFKYGRELENSGIEASSVDVIFSGYALNFIEDTVRFSHGVQSILKPGGLFVGYVKGGESGELRDFASAEEIKGVLVNMGFKEENIVVVEGGWDYLGSTEECIFFAKKNLEAKHDSSSLSVEVPLPFISRSEHFLANASDFSSRGVVQTDSVDVKSIERNWHQNIGLSDISKKISSFDSQKSQSIVKLLYKLVSEHKDVADDLVSSLLNRQINIDNLLRHLLVKYKYFSDLQKAIDSVSSRDISLIMDDLEQLYLIRTQIGYLLSDLSEFFDNINFFMSTDYLEERISRRAEIVGSVQLTQSIKDVINVITSRDISWREKENSLLDAQQFLMDYLRDYNYFIIAEYELDPIFYSRHAYPVTPPENKAYILRASIGDILHVAEYRLNTETYYVDKIYRGISRNRRLSAQYVNIEGVRHYMVYVDTFGDIWSHVERGYETDAIGGLLVRRQWGKTLPPQDSVIDSESKTKAFHEIIHDRFPGLGELPSFLCEIGYGPQPSVRLERLVDNLWEIHKGGDVQYIVNLINPEARSPHYKASQSILGRYLQYILENDILREAGLRNIIESIIVFNKEGGYELKESSLAGNRDAIIAALSILSEDEVRGIAQQWLKEAYDFVVDTSFEELTVSLPLTAELFSRETQDTLSVVSEKEKIIQATLEPISGEKRLSDAAETGSLPAVITSSLNGVLSESDKVQQANLITELATSLTEWNVTSAVNLVNASLRQKFFRAKALLHVAIKMEALGNRSKALELLKEVEHIIESGMSEMDTYPGPSSIMGMAYFLFNDIVTLKRKLGLFDEAEHDIESFGKCLLPDGAELKGFYWSRYSLLIEYAVKKKDTSLLNQIEDVVFYQKDLPLERALELQVQTALAESKVGNQERAHELLRITANSEIGWVTAKPIVDATRALADLGYIDEAFAKIKEVRKLREDDSNRVGVADWYLYQVSAEIKAKRGLIDEAKSEFYSALDKLTENPEYIDGRSVAQVIEGQVKAGFIDDAHKSTKVMRDYISRVNVLMEIAQKYHGRKQQKLAQEILEEALRISENIEDDGIRRVTQFKIATLETRMVRSLDGKHSETQGRILTIINKRYMKYL